MIPSPATLKVPLTSEDDGVLEHRHQVGLVQELHAGVEAEDGRDDRQPEVGRQRAADVRPDDVGAAQQRDAAVAAAPGEPAHVALDLGDVLGVAGARGAPRLHVLAEHRGVAAARAVDRRRRLHDQVGDARRLLAGREELHRPDDVELLHRVATTGAAGGRDHAHVDDGVDVLLGDDLGDDGVADVRAHERHVADVTAGRDDVDADDATDRGVLGDGGRTAAAEVTGDPGDEHDLVAAGHDRRALRYFPSLRRWTRVFFRSLRCFFFAMRLRRFLMTEPTKNPLHAIGSPGDVRGLRQPTCRRVESGNGRPARTTEGRPSGQPAL